MKVWDLNVANKGFSFKLDSVQESISCFCWLFSPTHLSSKLDVRSALLIYDPTLFPHLHLIELTVPAEKRIEAAHKGPRVKKGQVLGVGCWVPGRWLEALHQPSGGWMLRLHRPVNITPSERCRHDWREPEESHERARKGGRDRAHVALVEEEGQLTTDPNTGWHPSAAGGDR